MRHTDQIAIKVNSKAIGEFKGLVYDKKLTNVLVETKRLYPKCPNVVDVWVNFGIKRSPDGYAIITLTDKGFVADIWYNSTRILPGIYYLHILIGEMRNRQGPLGLYMPGEEIPVIMDLGLCTSPTHNPDMDISLQPVII